MKTPARKKYSLLAALALAMTVSLSACGSDEEPAPVETPSSEAPTETPAEEPTETPTEDPTEVPAEEPTEEPTEEPVEEAPASNNAVGKTYSFEAPKGWTDATKDMAQGPDSPLELAFMNVKTNESLNVVVIDGELTGVNDPATKKSIETELTNAGFSNISFPGSAELDGEEALRTLSEIKIGAKKFYSYQVFAVRDGKNYVVTVGGFDRKQIDANVDLMLSTWMWKA